MPLNTKNITKKCKRKLISCTVWLWGMANTYNHFRLVCPRLRQLGKKCETNLTF